MPFNTAHTILTGEKILLIPMSSSDKNWFYETACQSEGSQFWYGEQTGEELPDKEKFFEDFHQHYFTDEQNLQGRAFAIWFSGSYVGAINYNEINEEKSVSIDIIIGDIKYMSRGLGSDAIKTICQFLFSSLNLKTVWLEVLPHNLRAIRSYKKCGFRETGRTVLKNEVTWMIMEKQKDANAS